MKYIRALAHMFESQHLTVAGDYKNKHVIMATDRKLTIIEDHGEVRDGEPVEPGYIPSFDFKQVNPENLPIGLDEKFHPKLPEGTPVVTSEQESAASGRKLLPAKDALDLVMSLIAGMFPFQLPCAIHTLKDDWLAFRFIDGVMRIRSAPTYQGLNAAAEYEMATLDNAPQLEFALPVDLLRVCHNLASDKVVMSVKKKGAATYVCLRTPDCTIMYFTKPLKLQETAVTKPEDPTEEIPESPENVEEAADVDMQPEGEGQEPEQEPAEEPEVQPADEPVEQPAEEPADGADAQAAEVGTSAPEACAEEPGSSQSPGSGEPVDEPAQKPQADDYDVQEALDVLLPDLVKGVKDLTHASSVEMAKILKNIAKQTRKSLGRSVADPTEVAELKTKLAAETKRADAAEATLASVRTQLEPMKGMLNIKGLF